MRSVADYIQYRLDSGEVTLIENTPEDCGPIVEELTFYCYGERITLEIYKYYLNITDEAGSTWYKCEHGNLILSVLSAG